MTAPTLHPFGVENSPKDTLARCIDVLTFVGQERPLDVVSDEIERGRVWILLGVADALRSMDETVAVGELRPPRDPELVPVPLALLPADVARLEAVARHWGVLPATLAKTLVTDGLDDIGRREQGGEA